MSLTTHTLPGRSRRLRPAAVASLVAVLTFLGLLLAGPASAATGVTYSCNRTDYGCVSGSGFAGQSIWGSWGPGHNCVSYAAYRLSRNGAAKPWAGAIGNANQWDEKARGAGVRVDVAPAVGSIAQWDTGSYGHVAYVEAVTAAYIDVSEDNYLSDTSGSSSTRRLARSGSTYQAAEFIHVKDQGGASAGAGGSPIGSLDVVSQNGTGVRFRGWAIDPDTSAPIAVHAYVTPQHGVATTADLSRPDVAAVHPAFGDRHGFDVTRGGIVAGRYNVCAYAINAAGTPGGNTLLACRDLSTSQSPIGSLDEVTQDGFGVRFRGWAIDPDTSAPIAVHAYVTPQHGVATTADLSRPDVAGVFPASGDRHGFEVTRGGIVPGTYNVCAYGINVSGTAGGNTELGCRTFTVR